LNGSELQGTERHRLLLPRSIASIPGTKAVHQGRDLPRRPVGADQLIGLNGA
jgi:hypothetical protein